METVIGLLLMFGVSHGGETYCDGRQDGAQCYGALGGTVVLQLMDSASEIFRYEWLKKTTLILRGGKNRAVINLIADRSSFTPSDGTFRINDLSWNDGGEYTLMILDSNGSKSEQRTLLLTIQVVETDCDGRQDGAQCYGALGGTVVLQLMDSASEIFRYDWFKNKTTSVLRGGKNRAVINLIADRSSFTPSDGTFRINDLSWTDGSEYTLIIFDSNGHISVLQTLQLTIQAPVSSVLLVSECLSHGEMRVSCSSEGGDSPQYSWTLDGQTLTDTQLLSGNNETNNITLKPDVSGQLVCSVRNHISGISTCGFRFSDCTLFNGMHISQSVRVSGNTQCIEPTSASTTITDTTVGKETGITVSVKSPTNIPSSNQTVTSSTTDDSWYLNRSLLIFGLRAAVVILILSGIAVYFFWKKKKYENAEGSAVRRKREHQENSVITLNFLQPAP